jgi:membrane protein required for colicin V production
MTWVDLVVLAVLAVSGMLAFSRGLVHEVLGVSAWIGAAAFSYWGTPLARPRFEQWISVPEWAGFATVASLFLGSLLMLMLLSRWIAAVVRASALGGLDRTLGLVFGIARGAALVVFAYIAVGMVIPIAQWPEAVLQARALPLAYEGAAWAIAHLPPESRPRLYPPPMGREGSAEELLRAQPVGRAVGRPPRESTRD